MRIEIESIDRDNVVVVGNNDVLGYLGRFRCPIVSGAAVLVPYRGGENQLDKGNTISVETDQKSVSDFMIVASTEETRIGALPTPGDYTITGTIMLNTNDEVFDITVSDFSFAVDNEETQGVIPKAGQRVSFTIHGLSLWDEGI